ncbi:GNAT family N-acetyltransferase [Luteimonas gilva]|uniref:GNAT family N-acetyltransferase n=1 Tax=Luteimonas gilva TaxID=2572684 RepID=A0A4V5ZPU9_9GAMM|nr:GNAT family N-acetyltransferase [Luteimonas gilva]TKR30273.1 GNAT family N-acetyltransferase [Luteimonas gilva]
MSEMTDPTEALKSFQESLLTGSLELERGRLDPDVYLHVDRADGKPRFTYVRLEGRKVTALASFVPNGYYLGHPNLAAGYAVLEAYRNQGLAKDILRAGIAELRNGFKGRPPFYVEAVISVDNAASLKVAAEVLGGTTVEFNDEASGRRAIRYARKFDTGR